MLQGLRHHAVRDRDGVGLPRAEQRFCDGAVLKFVYNGEVQGAVSG